MKFILLIAACLYSTQLLAVPAWYENRNLSVTDIEIIGYGQGLTMQEARNGAGKDIAYQLGVDVSITTTKKSKLINNKFDSRATENLKQLSRHKLSNLDVVKSEEDGGWYVAVKTSAVPFWYESRVYKAGPDQINGYGSASVLRQAQLNAAEEIALQMGGKIKVDTTQSIKQTNKSLEQAFSQDIRLESNQELGKIRLLNSQRIKNTWYVVAAVGDERHYSLKLADKLKKIVSACDEGNQVHYLSGMNSIQSINKALGCSPSMDLQRSNGKWVLDSNGVSQILSDKEFEEFLSPITSGIVSISSDKSTVYENDSYTLNISSTKQGYISCFIVYGDGKVALLFDNTPVAEYQQIEFPDKNSGLELVAELPKRGVKTTDLYILLYTEVMQDFSEFEDISETIMKSEDGYRFGKLIRRINSPFASTLVHTLPISRKIY